jgi:uncharacterized membrane protein YeaQ/YmgE (transglycosylase-associated protein family)
MDIDTPTLLIWLVIGILSGWLAARIVRGGRLGPVGNMVAGVIGASIGGYGLQQYHYLPETLAGAVIGGVIGAVLLLLITSLFAAND